MINIHSVKEAEHVHTFPKGEEVLGTHQFRGTLFVVTNRCLYYLGEGKLWPVKVGKDGGYQIRFVEIDPIFRSSQ